MQTHTTQPIQETAAATIDLMPYINALINARWWLLAAAIASGALTGWLAFSKPYMYAAEARVSIVDIEDPGGVSPDDRRASEVLTLVEHGFVMGTTRDNYSAVMRARLVSRDFTVRFLDEANVHRYFYPEQWDEKNRRWRDGFSPDRGMSFTRFRDEVRAVEHNEETDIITVKMLWHDPVVARDLANQYVAAFNEYIRERTQEDVARKQAFLHEELRRSEIVEIQQSIYRLIEAQTAISMLASSREEYVLEIIDPAAIPYRSFNMSRKRKVVLGVIAGTLVAVFAVLGLVLVRGMLGTILAYRAMDLRAQTAIENQSPLENGNHS